MEKPPVLNEEEIQIVICKAFPLFDLNEEDEEDRKKTTLSLLEAQRDADTLFYEPIVVKLEERIKQLEEQLNASEK